MDDRDALARAEVERRWPDDRRDTDMERNCDAHRRGAFVAGAAWERETSRPDVGDLRERVAASAYRAMATAKIREGRPFVQWKQVSSWTREAWLAVAAAVLAALPAPVVSAEDVESVKADIAGWLKRNHTHTPSDGCRTCEWRAQEIGHLVDLWALHLGADAPEAGERETCETCDTTEGLITDGEGVTLCPGCADAMTRQADGAGYTDTDGVLWCSEHVKPLDAEPCPVCGGDDRQPYQGPTTDLIMAGHDMSLAPHYPGPGQWCEACPTPAELIVPEDDHHAAPAADDEGGQE